MNRIFNLLVLLGLLVVFGSAKGQETWSLQKCIQYALDNNIKIKQQGLNSQYYSNQLMQSKLNRLPNLNGSLSNSTSYGRSLTVDNTYENGNSNQTSGSLSSGVTLWNGFILKNAIKQADMDLRASLEDLQKAKNDIMLNIAASYLDILLNRNWLLLLKVSWRLPNSRLSGQPSWSTPEAWPRGAFSKSKHSMPARN
jgi:outer membrane protein